MREHLHRSRPVLRRRRTVIASADRVLIAGLVHLFDDIGPLVGATTSEQDALACLDSSQADLLICSDLLESGSGPSLVAAAKTLQPELHCLMLIQRPLLSTIERYLRSSSEGLCVMSIPSCVVALSPCFGRL